MYDVAKRIEELNKECEDIIEQMKKLETDYAILNGKRIGIMASIEELIKVQEDGDLSDSKHKPE